MTTQDLFVEPDRIPVGKAKDLTGLQFTGWTVLYRVESPFNDYRAKQAYWKCRCECGNIGIVRGTDLIRGHSKRCKDCANQIKIEKMKQKNTKDWIGKIFAIWKVLEVTDKKDSGGHTILLCQCTNCGAIEEISSNLLQQGKKRSCKCLTDSYGDHKVKQLYDEHHIIYKHDVPFEDCINPETHAHLRFDWIVWENEQIFFVEIDGIQHFEEVLYFNGSLEETQTRDRYKNEWCKAHNYTMIRIPYWEWSKMSFEDIMLSTSKYILTD